MVRTLVCHLKKFQDCKKELDGILEEDLEKPKNKKLKETVNSMKDACLFIIFNKRTGSVATADWVQKHIVRDNSGKPINKNPKSTAKPCLMSLRVKMIECPEKGLTDIVLHLQVKPDGPFQKVRCYSLQEGCEQSGMSLVLTGYDHLLSAEDSEDTLLGFKMYR